MTELIEKHVTKVYHFCWYGSESIQSTIKSESKMEYQLKLQFYKNGWIEKFSESSAVKRQMPDQASGLPHCWAPFNSVTNTLYERCPP